MSTPFLSLGIDIGTTTISAALVDISSRKQISAWNVPNGSDLPTPDPSRHEQDAEAILSRVMALLRTVRSAHPKLHSIGLTGQMHGIVYLNRAGMAVSPLYTWQDARALSPYEKRHTHCEEIARRTGETVPAGYGFATHFYNAANGLAPNEAVSLCTIMDYAAMRLTGRVRPLMHSTNAASLGLFDADRNAFKSDALSELSGRPLEWPEVAAGEAVIGHFDGIPVTAAIGDNQASFFGSVREEDSSILVNYGTGSQISWVDRAPQAVLSEGLERRPYLNGQTLLCGSALCGGRAYALLEGFFRAYQRAAGLESGSQYAVLNALAEEALASNAALSVRTTFCGTRLQPDLRGAIWNIGEDSFTPQALTLGVLRGMAQELFDLLPQRGIGAQMLIASGNAVQRNPAFQKVLSDVFGLPLHMPGIQEEAAFGAALSAACSSGQSISIEDVKACIP